LTIMPEVAVLLGGKPEAVNVFFDFGGLLAY